MHIRDAKAKLRQSIEERLERLPSHKQRAESRSLCRRIIEELPPAPLRIAAYAPLRSEADIRPLLLELPKRGDSVYLPCFEGGILTFRRLERIEDLRPGSLHILEPLKTAPLLQAKELSIALVPGRAFDTKGWRLGRGNGGYDTWIRSVRAMNRSARFFGVALELQLLHEVPHEDHDERMDAIVTARGLLAVGN